MAGARFADIPKHIAFIIMLACAIWIFFLGLTSKSDNPAFSDIGGASLSLLLQISLGVWCVFAMVFIGITLHHARRNPFWPLITLLLVLIMTAFFTTYLGFDPLDWSTWGPLAAVMGIIVKEGIHHTYESSERGQLAALRDCLMGSTDDDTNDIIEASTGHSRRNALELEDRSYRNANNA